MTPPHEPGAITEGPSSNIENGSRARNYGSSGAQRRDYGPGWRDEDFKVVNDHLSRRRNRHPKRNTQTMVEYLVCSELLELL